MAKTRQLPDQPYSDNQILAAAAMMVRDHLDGMPIVEAENILDRARLLIRQTHAVDGWKAAKDALRLLRDDQE